MSKFKKDRKIIILDITKRKKKKRTGCTQNGCAKDIIETGKIQAGEAGLRKELEQLFGGLCHVQ